jgi:hypothetical protein
VVNIQKQLVDVVVLLVYRKRRRKTNDEIFIVFDLVI